MTRLPDAEWRPLTLADMTRESPLLLDLTFVPSDEQIADLEEQKRAFFRRIGRETPRQKVERLVREDRAACNDGRWVRRHNAALHLFAPFFLNMAASAPTRELRADMLSRIHRSTKPRYRWECRR